MIYPRLIRRDIPLHPLAVIVAVLAGAKLAGVAGVFLAVPIVAVASVAFRHWLEWRSAAVVAENASVTAVRFRTAIALPRQIQLRGHRLFEEMNATLAAFVRAPETGRVFQEEKCQELRRRYLEIDVEEPLAAVARVSEPRERAQKTGLRLLRPTGTG